MMNEFFRYDGIDLIPTIATRDVFDVDDESFMFFCHLDADDFFDAYASIPPYVYIDDFVFIHVCEASCLQPQLRT